MALDTQPVYTYCFTGMAFDDWQTIYMRKGSDIDNLVYPVSQYNSFRSYAFSVPENYFNVTDTAYYVVSEYQKDVTYNLTDSGQVDMISMLYSDEEVPVQDVPGNFDPYGIDVQANATLY